MTSILEIVENQRPSLINEDRDARIDAIKKINRLEFWYSAFSKVFARTDQKTPQLCF